jgi:hypothetical protein
MIQLSHLIFDLILNLDSVVLMFVIPDFEALGLTLQHPSCHPAHLLGFGPHLPSFSFLFAQDLS